MTHKQIAEALGLSLSTMRRHMQACGIRLSLRTYKREVIYNIVLRFMASSQRITFATKAKVCYNYTRWAVRYGMYVPKTVLKIARSFDPGLWRVDDYARQQLVIRNEAGKLVTLPIQITDTSYQAIKKPDSS